MASFAPMVEPEPLAATALRRGGVCLALSVLLLACHASTDLARVRCLRVRLEAALPPPQVVAAGLAAQDPTLVETALRRLAALPPPVVAGLLRGAPFGRGGPLDHLAPPVLARRGDTPARAALARLGRREFPEPAGS